MRFSLSKNWFRFLGISTLFFSGYIVVIGIFGNVDVSPLLPIKLAASIQAAWPKMPFFKVEEEAVNDGKAHEIYYTVPTRQLTPQEIAAMMKALSPAPPKPPASKVAEGK